MANESTTTTELYLGFKGSDGKSKRLVIAHPEDNLDEATTRGAMKKIADAHLFEKQGIDMFNEQESAKYIQRKETTIFNDKKKEK